MIMLTIGSHLGAHRKSQDPIYAGRTLGPLGLELLANQHYNATTFEPNLISRFVRRWIEMPQENSDDPKVIDMVGAYRQATGVDLRDLMTVGVSLWAANMNGRVRVHRDYFRLLGWIEERLEGVLKLCCADVDSLRHDVDREVALFGAEWVSSTFERFPLARMKDGSLLILDPAFWAQRTFGLLPIFDVTSTLADGGPADRKLRTKVESCFSWISEKYAVEIIESIVGPQSTTSTRRVFNDAQLKAAYTMRRQRVADISIDYGDAWVVIEVTTSRLRRESVVGRSDEDIMQDVDKLVGEVEQIDHTISSIRTNESRLTGVEKTSRVRKFFPLLVVTEGFPVNPMTLMLVRKSVELRGLPSGYDVADLEIASLEELEIIEGVRDRHGLGLREILEGKQTASLWRSSIKNYLVSGLRLQPRNARAMHIWEAISCR